MKKRTFIVVFIFIAISQVFCQPVTGLKPTIILISIDGFHPSYLDRLETGTLKSIAEDGVRAEYMIPVFPTKTFPNHYSIATGLYSEHHGIIHNTIYDPLFQVIFRLSNRNEVQNGRWWQGEPIWITAEKNNIKTAPLFWPGSEAEISAKRPSYWQAYDGNMKNSERVNKILSWLDLPLAERPQFLTLYLSDMDNIGHNYSPQSAKVDSGLLVMDELTGQLVNGLLLRNLYDKINLIIVSDHGMARVEAGNRIILDDYFNIQQTDTIIWDYQLTGIFPKAGKKDSIYSRLKECRHISVFRKEQIPERFHYRDNRRIPPIICLADEGWKMIKRSEFEKKQKENRLTIKPTGAHGYDNQLPSMQALFLAKGPAFKEGLVSGPFENIQLYNLMARILHIPPAPNDGTMELADRILKQK